MKNNSIKQITESSSKRTFRTTEDIYERVKDAISTRDFKEKYDKLLGLYSLALSDSDKPKDKQLFHPELKKFVFHLFKDVYDIEQVKNKRREKYV